MNDILANRPKQTSDVPDSMIQPLTVQERNNVAIWIHDQLLAPKPSSSEWIQLWTGRAPFFGVPIALMLHGQEVVNITDCCDPLADASQLERWSSLDPGLRFILQRGDLTRFFIYGAQVVVLVDRTDPSDAWCFGPDASGEWHRPTSEDVLHALLCSWRSGRSRSKRARERLCDIADKTLHGSRRP